MKVTVYMKFLKEQKPPFPCGINKGWFEIDEGVISIPKLEQFLKDLRYEGFELGVRAARREESSRKERR